jgi:adenosylmethionine---8-amino-7-oxononanoate aminotransferase
MHPNIWKPFTILKGAQEPIKVTDGEGIWLTLEDGRQIIDCISSWWVNLHGHSHPKIAEAIYQQAQKLEHVIFANFSHEPAERLAAGLAERLPGQLNRVFFSDNGSTAVEVALKVAWQYWKNMGRERKKFIAFEGAYHGDTLGAMSAGDRSVFTRVFDELMFDVEFLSYPDTWTGDEDITRREDEIINQLEEKLSNNHDDYAAIIIEPLIQGAGGMRMCREEFLQKLHWVNRQFNTLLIFDEVMTGFGRTGDWFACRRAHVEPDLVCLSKGITGGFMPLAVTVCSDEIYEAFHSDDPMHTLWHGHSYTANPLGCAAANASMELMEDHEEAFKTMEKIHQRELELFTGMDRIEKTRVTGTIAAFSLKTDQEEGYLNKIADDIKKKCIDYELLIRPLGNVVYLMPPYCITPEELELVYERLGELLKGLEW